MSAETPLARVEGLGSARSGTAHFWRQRATALALIPLSVWFACDALSMIGADRNEAVAFLARPANAIAFGLFIVAALYHMALGVRVVIEDYVQNEGSKIVLLLLNQFFAWVIGAVCIFALVKIVL